MPSRGGPCYKVIGDRPGTGLHYPLDNPNSGAFSKTLDEYEKDTFVVVVDGPNQLDLVSVRRAPQAHMYVVIFHYSLGTDDWIYLRSGEECKGMAPEQTVGVPVSVFVARVKGT
jgi:hypothetical protein